LSKTLSESAGQLFRPQHPEWACEFTSRHITIAGVDARRRRVLGKAAREVPADTLDPGLANVNIQNSERLRAAIRDTLRAASFKGSEIALVLPDEAARISLVNAETLPKSLQEQQTFLRWKLKKTVPFDVDAAQIAFRVIGGRGERNERNGGHDIVVALSPRSIIQEYETLMESLDIHAGFVTPSTLAALNLMLPPKDDMLFVKLAPDCVTTTVFQHGRISFYRRVAELGVYESVYPTMLYYQDKLGGTTLHEIVVCGYDVDAKPVIAELHEKTGIPVRQMEPGNVEDVYKPALGAVHLSWATLI
jgi:type IV pilus assembly protein PilM